MFANPKEDPRETDARGRRDDERRERRRQTKNIEQIGFHDDELMRQVQRVRKDADEGEPPDEARRRRIR